MNLHEFEDHLDRFGGDLATWPLDLRRPAEELLVASADARALKATMDRVEACLRQPSPAAAMSASAMAARAMRRPQIGRGRPWMRAAACGAATAAALLLGILVGDLHADQHEDNADQLVASVLEPMSVADVD